ncbi:MAG: N-acetylmuramoyl-L-alanine amidase, partial [Longicatena sp.]
LLLVLLCIYKNNNFSFLKDANMFSQKKYDVVLDAGHGGHDSGAQYDDIDESTLNLEITKKIGKVLEQKGYSVKYTRDSDEVSWTSEEAQDLEERLRIANNSNAKLFVSIHTNADEYDEGSYGYEIWGKIKNETVYQLSKNVLDEMNTLQYSQNRGMIDQDVSTIKVLNENKLPAILIETGFISSEIDRSYLTNTSNQEKLANKIANGIAKTLESMLKE